MKLYVCYDFLKHVVRTPRPGGHPCGKALQALEQAGYEPAVQAVGGLGLPLLNKTAGRAEVQRLSGSRVVPALVLDDGQVIRESDRIVKWAQANPAGAPAPA